MDEQLYGELVKSIRKESIKVEGVIDTEKCHIRKTGMYYFVDLHVIVDGDISVKTGHDIAHNLKAHLINNIENVKNVLIHIEPYIHHEQRTNK